jgi:hypothetical protein
MSALGQKQTFAPQNVMSALPLKAEFGLSQRICPDQKLRNFRHPDRVKKATLGPL